MDGRGVPRPGTKDCRVKGDPNSGPQGLPVYSGAIGDLRRLTGFVRNLATNTSASHKRTESCKLHRRRRTGSCFRGNIHSEAGVGSVGNDDYALRAGAKSNVVSSRVTVTTMTKALNNQFRRVGEEATSEDDLCREAFKVLHETAPMTRDANVRLEALHSKTASSGKYVEFLPRCVACICETSRGYVSRWRGKKRARRTGTRTSR